MSLPDWITLDEPNGKAYCSACQMGVTAPPSFGSIPRPNKLAAFIVGHATHKDGAPTGLTSAGRATKAAREVLR